MAALHDQFARVVEGIALRHNASLVIFELKRASASLSYPRA